MNSLKLHLTLALTLAFGLVIGETIRRWGAWGFWAGWLDDYLLAAFLVFGVWCTARNKKSGIRILIAAWGSSAGLLYGSFFSKIADPQQDMQSQTLSNEWLTLLVGTAFFTALIGMIWSLRIPLEEKGESGT